MLPQKDMEHLNAVIKTISDKAQRIEHLNKITQEPPLMLDEPLQDKALSEALAHAKDLRELMDEAIRMLEIDLKAELVVYQ
jgi:hypothetical protein